MLASKMIEDLQTLIREHGDREVELCVDGAKPGGQFDQVIVTVDDVDLADEGGTIMVCATRDA
jgi:hypothetical protein